MNYRYAIHPSIKRREYMMKIVWKQTIQNNCGMLVKLAAVVRSTFFFTRRLTLMIAPARHKVVRTSRGGGLNTNVVG